MLLYHSFPRGIKDRSGPTAELQHALRQLALIMNWGLLLTPENLIIPPNPLERTTIRKKVSSHQTCFPQSRACFTLAHRAELSEPGQRIDRCGEPRTHLDLFGSFAIGLNPIRARQLGVAPVVYHYSDDIEVNVTRELLLRLRDLLNLMLVHARLEAKASVPGRDTLSEPVLDVIGYVLEGEPEVSEMIANTATGDAKRVVELFDTDRVPAWNLADIIHILFNFFQTADSEKNIGSLAYFRQREWRIARLYGRHVRCYPLACVAGEVRTAQMPHDERDKLRCELRKLSPEFFTNDRLDGSMILMSSNDIPFFDFVEEILLPQCGEKYVKNLLNQARVLECFDVLHEKYDRVCFKRRRTQ